ncbi:outer membrane beta-barrel protein [Indibacter alkaliphilus]|nr:outer membrane beta-barrel protein [Indibacter alkaliphilus]
MKQFNIICFFLLISWLTHAQTEKGRFLIGAGTNLGLSESPGMMNLSFSRQKTFIDDGLSGQTNNNNIFIATKVGYFFFDNLVAGLDLALGSGRGTSTFDAATQNLDSKSSLFSIGPFVRYYIPSGKILPFAEVNALFGSRNIEIGGFVSSESQQSFTNIGGGLGLAFLLGRRSSIDLVLNYNSNKINFESEDYTDRKNTLGIKIGFTMFLGKIPEI